MSTMTKKFASRSTRTTIAMALCMLGFLFAVALPQTAWAALTPNYTWYTSNPNASTFTISTPAQWLGFVELVNGTAGDIDGDGKADAPRDFAGKTVKLSNTITSLNFQGEKVKPAGGQNGTVFAGVFDGNNIPFSQFTIDTSHITAKSIENVGLIGATTKTSTVKNVATGSSAVVRIEQSKGGKAVSNVGLIVGKAGGSVENCFVGASGSVTITSHVE